MNLFFALLPVYIFGNLHCASMCGPLVALLAKHPYKKWYFLGRLSSFTLAGVFSAEVGMALFFLLSRWHIAASLSFLFGGWIITMGACLLLKVRLSSPWSKKFAHLSISIGRLMTRNSCAAVFLFGLCTILLPCGQTVVVFSSIALNGDPLQGLIQGFLFAIFTSPALITAMRASHFFCKQQRGYHLWMGCALLFVGVLAVLRGLAEMNVIKHLVLNPSAPPQFHIIFF